MEALTVLEREAIVALIERVSDLCREVGALTAGMAHLAAGQEAHTALLSELLLAVTELGVEGGSDGLAEALGRIADSLGEQGAALAGMRTGLDAIPAAVATALATPRTA